MAAVSENRKKRLVQFFKVYPHLNPQIDDQALVPVAITLPRKRLFSFRRRPAEVMISSLFLNDALPLWIEATIVHCAIRLHQRAQGLHSQPVEQERPYKKLNAILAEIKAKEKQQVIQALGPESLRSTWCSLRRQYFPNRHDLDSYAVQWASRKRIRLLATCNISDREVVVAPAMNQPSCVPFLEPLLYHEMCHAALGEPKVVNGRAIYHGREFRTLEQRHPGIRILDAWIRRGGWDGAVESFELYKNRNRRVPVLKVKSIDAQTTPSEEQGSTEQSGPERTRPAQLHLF
jgi:hypothetical protein